MQQFDIAADTYWNTDYFIGDRQSYYFIIYYSRKFRFSVVTMEICFYQNDFLSILGKVIKFYNI